MADASLDLLVDARVAARGHTGIARYVRELVPRLGQLSNVRITALLDRRQQNIEGAANAIRVHAPFLSPAEQLEVPQRVVRWRGVRRRKGVFWVPAYNAACLTPGPLVLTLHDAAHLALPDLFGVKHVAYYRTVVRLAALRAAAVITISEFSRRELIKRIGVPENRIHVIPGGVNLPHTPEPEEITRARAAHRLERPYVACVCNFKPHKNLETLLRAAPKFAHAASLLLIGGTEAELGNALPAARASGAEVIVPRNVPDSELWPLVAGASVFAFPSRYEGFGLPPLEAMALGVPVVTTTAGALPEVTGDAALLVNPEDEEGLGRSILRLLEDKALARELSEKGRARAASFTWDIAARRTARVLLEARG